MEKPKTRRLDEIAREIRSDWARHSGTTRGISYAAKPYLSAISYLDSINDRYGEDSAKSIVLYFLSNASTWKGEVARRVKKELKEMCK